MSTILLRLKVKQQCIPLFKVMLFKQDFWYSEYFHLLEIIQSWHVEYQKLTLYNEVERMAKKNLTLFWEIIICII